MPLYKIVDTPKENSKPLAKTDIFSRSNENWRGANSYTIPNSGAFLKSDYFKALFSTSNGIKDIAYPSGDASSLEEAAEDLAAALILPPSEDYSTIIPPEGEKAVQQIEELTKQQLIQQFYEIYMVPIGTKEIYNRLGAMAGNVADVHSLYPKGVKGLIATDSNASWRTNLNFSFVVDEGLGTPAYKYSSLAFPPFVSHETFNANDLMAQVKTPETLEANALDTTFDMTNVLYKRNKGTFRFPAFKQVNDNINTVQLLLNRCFGIESTYINEWDLSMYMQEGILSYIEKLDKDGDKIRLPQLVSTLTYGLMDDAPVEELTQAGSKDSSIVNFDKITPFASLNLAVSTRYAIDNEPIGQQSNTLNYIIADYPYSAYWYPYDEGANSTRLNVSIFWDTLTSFYEVGEPFNEKAPTSKWFTPAIFHGEDLSKSTRTLESIIKYSDNRNAILSGWNSTDVQGNPIMSLSDTTNESRRSNAYSYLPFWKQFYTDADDGMSDIDKYIQEIYAKDGEMSFLNASYQIANIIAAENQPFQDRLAEARKENLVSDLEEDSEALANSAAKIADSYGGKDYSDYSFSIAGAKLTIPGSKLLKMFLQKSSEASKAQSMADSLTGPDLEDPDASAATGSSASPSAALKNATPTKYVGEPKSTVIDGQEVEVSTYVPEDNDEIASKKVVGDGIAEWSPMLYGGPHGKYFSPLTLEGYTQPRNQMLANVPSIDTWHLFHGGLLESRDMNIDQASVQNIRGLEVTKNFKGNGSYIDAITVLTPNERVSIMDSGQPFGVRGLKPNTGHYTAYYSNLFYRTAFWQSCKYITFRIFRKKIRIPNFWYYKVYKTNNGHWANLVNHTDDYGTSHYLARLDTSVYEEDVSAMPDWTSEDFRLIPTCAWIGEFTSLNDDGALDAAATRMHIEHDQARFRRMTAWHQDLASGRVTYDYKADNLAHHNSYMGNGCVKYLIVPTAEGTNKACGALDWYVAPFARDRRWLHYDTYSTPGTKWFEQLKKLWNSGTRETSVTLPIIDYNSSGRPISTIVHGVVNIIKSQGLVWRWRLWFYASHSWRRHGCSWCCPHKVYCYHYVWILVRGLEDNYNMFFRPSKTMWALPTKHILDKEAVYTTQRDKSTSNIIKRWCTDAPDDNKAKRFNSISSGAANSPNLFPFTWEYMVKYGEYNPWLSLPGITARIHDRPAQDVRILHSRGLYYSDIIQSYREKGYVEVVDEIEPYYKHFVDTRLYTDTSSGTRGGNFIPLGGALQIVARVLSAIFGRFVVQRSQFTNIGEFYWTSYNVFYRPLKFSKQAELTKLLGDSHLWPSVLNYQINKTPYLSWYKPKDTIEVFKETLIQQLQWLKQLRDYANLYLSDSLIYEAYQKGVDGKIQAITLYQRMGNKNGKNYKDGCGGWTESFTEDINYYDALAIVEKAFNTQDASRNTIYDLVCRRIERFEAFLVYAKKLSTTFETDPMAMYNFVTFASNVKSYLSCAETEGKVADDVLFDSTGAYVADSLFEINSNTTYNMLKNPAALLWAYLNVLYQVRKYWVNVRLNKRVGSFWQLRSLERVLTFFLAEGTGEDSPTADKKSVPQGTIEELKTKNIIFVQQRDSFTDMVNNTETSPNPETLAIYLKVNYLGTPNPTSSSKWNEETQRYNGEEIVYVNEAYRWAKKPQDGLYYVMSKTITDTVTQVLNTLKTAVNLIFAKTYKVTADDVKNVLDIMQHSKLDYSTVEANATFDTFKSYFMKTDPADKNLNQIEKAADSVTDVSSQRCLNAVTMFENALVQYKRSYYLELAQSYLYAIYIKWQPQQVWSGLSENDDKGEWHIDEWQRENTEGKERKVTDLYGYEHTSSEAISAGITFDVSASIDAGTLLSSPEALKNSSLLEVLCSSVDTMDLWRVEIPEDLHIPVNLLAEKPVLVPAYQIDANLGEFKPGQVTKSVKSVLAGISTNLLSPILEPTEDMLTINTLSALGKFDDISTVGLSVEALVESGN